MMEAIKVGIVEDEMVIALTIESTLEELGYQICGPANTYTEALKMIETEKPDLLLLDINLSGSKDGIDVAEKIKTDYNLPFIFLTAFSDKHTVERAKKVNPNAYIVKPFTKDELFATIEIAFDSFNKQKQVDSKANDRAKDFAVFKDAQTFHKVFYKDIVYLESKGNYTLLNCITQRQVVVRSPLTELLESLPAHIFCRVHRSFAVNIHQVISIDAIDVVLSHGKVPLSKSYRDSFLSQIGA